VPTRQEAAKRQTHLLLFTEQDAVYGLLCFQEAGVTTLRLSRFFDDAAVHEIPGPLFGTPKSGRGNPAEAVYQDSLIYSRHA
jgi:hypothetical protein